MSRLITTVAAIAATTLMSSHLRAVIAVLTAQATLQRCHLCQAGLAQTTLQSQAMKARQAIAILQALATQRAQ